MTAISSAPSTAGSPPPRTLGVYRVLHLLGEGGMGQVYLAEHTLIGRRVAIKVLNAEVAADPEILSRFFMEARAVNEIRHPNIVEVTDFGTADGQPYIVMELLEGETLADRVRARGALAEEAVVRIGRQIASSLGAVHERGIVHRDLKPANIFLRNHPDYPDFVKILDFGIAKLMGRDLARNHQTQMGTIMGTPAYMSPEQCLGEASLDLRSDVYSLGVVLFEMATGAHPFPHEAMGRVIMAHIQERPPAPRSLRPGMSDGLAALILRALAKKPAERFGSMRDLRAALDAVTATAGAAESGWTRPLPSAGSPPTPPRLNAPTVSLSPASRAATTSANALSEGERLSTAVRARLEAGALELPALPPLVALGLDIAQSPAFSFPAAVDLLRRDARLPPLVLRMANLEPYDSRAPAMTLEQAIARIGAQGLALALVEHAARPVIENRTPRADALFRRPWPHALAGAFIARRLMLAALPRDEASHGYLAALLRDIGQPLVATLVAELERPARVALGARTPSDATRVSCVVAHQGGLTAAVAKAWRLPAPVVDALAEHPETAGGLRLRGVVRLAARLADLEGFYLRREDALAAEAALPEARAALGVDEVLTRRASQRVREWVLSRV